MSRDTLKSAYEILELQLGQFLAAIDGIPDDDLRGWRPAATTQGGGEMSTFSILAVHIVGAGEWRVFQQVYGDSYDRDRDAEFRATASAAEIHALFDRWLAGYRDRLERETQPDLSSLPDTPRDDRPTWTRMHWLLSMIDHSALHVGHAQIQRQLWLAERAAHPQ
jgi:hypothetical protein